MQRVNETNKAVQKQNMDLSTNAHLLSFLVENFDFLRDIILIITRKLTGNENYAQKRIIIRKLQFEENNSEASLSKKETMRTICFILIIDNL